MRTTTLVFLSFIAGSTVTNAQSPAPSGSSLPVAAPLNSDSAGQSGLQAVQSVFRIICPSQNSSGTGFLHKTGKALTAEHVVRGCTDAFALLSNGTRVALKTIKSDPDRDLALLELAASVAAPALEIVGPGYSVNVGAQVTTWGFPMGYGSLAPMLSVGYLSGTQQERTSSGKLVNRIVVNAAFNSGNSGGPLIHVESGKVIGVVASKLAPISENTLSALQALNAQNSGFMYTAKRADGSTFNVSEGQVIASVLEELRRSVQLVIGMATMPDDLRTFLQENGIEP